MAFRRPSLTSLSVFGLVVATVTASTLPVLAVSAAADTSVVSATSAPYGGSELAQAAQTGSPVEVSGLTTETSQVMAEPDGTFQLTADRGPVRAMTNSGWAPIDTTLAVNGDGTYSPKVTTTRTTFGAGGGSLLVSIGTGQSGIDTYWPTNLPTPTVSGNTITYSSVRPNIDLVLTAEAVGFTETLVVKNAAAAAALNASPVVLNAVGRGVGVSQNPDGSIVGTDPGGHVVFGSPTPAAWDSSVTSNDPTEHSTVTQAANALVAALGHIAKQGNGGTQITLTTPAALLNNASTVYPIYVDPSIGSKKTSDFRTVQSGGWNYGTGSTEPMRVGYCGWSGCTSVEGNARSYFDFDTTALNSQPVLAHVYSASVKSYEVWNAESGATNVNLTQSGSFSQGTTYPGPFTSTLQTDSSNCGWNNANYCDLTFNNSNVVNYAQAAANNNWSTLTFALSAPSENNASYWKKFSSTATDTTLTVVYNYPPGNAAAPTVSSTVACLNKTVFTHDSTPTFSSSAASYNGTGTKVGITFSALAHPLSGGVQYSNTTPVVGAGGSTISWTAPTLPQGAYSVHAQAQTASPDTPSQLSSAWSAYTDFTVDTVAPATPTLSSFQYPQGYWGTTPNNPGSGSFTLAGASDVAGYTFAFNTGTVPTLTDTTCGYTTTSADHLSGMRTATNGIASLSPTAGALHSGYNTLTVKAFDDAHNLSGATTYTFYVSPDTTGSTVSFTEAEAIPVAQSGGPIGYTYTQSLTSDSAGHDSEVVSNAASSFTYTLNPAQSGYYALGVQLPTGTHNATLAFQVNGQDVNDSTGALETVNTCTTTPGTKFMPLGGFRLNVGTDPKTNAPYVNSLTVKMASTTCGNYTYNTPTGTTAPSGYPPNGYNDNGFTAGVDDIITAPVSGVSFASLQAAFNNKGIGVDNTNTGASFDQSTSDHAMSQSAMSARGITQGGTYSIGGETFSVPTAAPNGSDNVIAAGQTITMPGTVVGTWSSPGYVDLLVGSTCGDVVTNQAKAVGLSFQDATAPGGTDDPTWTLDSNVPDWVKTADSTVQSGYTVTMDHYLSGSGGTPTATPVTLYLMKAPIPQNFYNLPLTSVTLPSVGTDFASTCDGNNNALHVFAITTSQN